MNIEQIIERAKAHCLAEGDHTPTIFVECADGAQHMLLLADGYPSRNTHDKVLQFFSVGRRFGQSLPSVQIQQVVFVTEVWVSLSTVDGKRKYAFPEEDPDRQECLMIVVMETEPSIQQTMYHVDMIRDGEGRLRDLYQRPEEPMQLKSDLLPSFLAGVKSASMSDRELMLHALRNLDDLRQH